MLAGDAAVSLECSMSKAGRKTTANAGTTANARTTAGPFGFAQGRLFGYVLVHRDFAQDESVFLC